MCALLLQGRLLHYFPPEPTQLNGTSSTVKHHQRDSASADASDPLASDGHQVIGRQDTCITTDSKEEEDWCGWHTDHGSLTG